MPRRKWDANQSAMKARIRNEKLTENRRKLGRKTMPDAPDVTDSEAIKAALELAVRYGGIDGDHHKAWVIDQMVRILARDRYAAIVADAKDGEDGPETYDWDEGIAP